MTSKPALLLLPNLLGELPHAELFLPNSVFKAVSTLDGLIAESESGGRRYLKRFETKKPFHEVPIALFNEHSKESDIDFILEPITKGERWGLVSDAGLPCIADPGYQLVQRARQIGIMVQAFVGPSSIFMALMLSGLPAQKFYFHGYLDKTPNKRQEQIKKLFTASKTEGSTQIFIEAPYRNAHTLQAVLDDLPNDRWLCVAWDLTLPTQGIVCMKGEQWKKSPPPNLEKKPAIFIIA